MGVPLPDLARQLLDRNAHFVMSTIQPDGSPQSSVVWARRDGDDVLVSTLRGRRKERNLRRDPRTSLVAYDPDNPYTYVEIRGECTMTDEGGRELIDELSRRYAGKGFPEEPPDHVRVVIRVRPTRVVAH